MQREKSSIIHINIGINEFRETKRIAKKTGCKIKIEKKKGFPFILNRYKKRKIFFGTLIVIFLIMFTISRYIWNIDIVGNETIPTEEILKDLNNSGLLVGENKSRIDTKKIINDVRIKRDDIAWIGISIKGTNATVKIVEADKKPEIIDKSEYCNIVATKDCVIEKITSNNGTAMVKNGDVIKKGTVLIAGWMEGKYTGVRYEHASGEVIGKVWYSQKAKVELKQRIKEQTGSSETKYGILINNFKINFFKTLSKFQNYDTMYTNKKVKIFSNFYIPVEVIKYDNYETTYKDVEYTLEEAKEKAKNIAEEEILKQIENKENIKNVTVNYVESEGCVEAEVIYEVLENIGTEEKIVF